MKTLQNINLPAEKLPVYKEPEDFRSSMHWRIFRILAEFIEGFGFIADFKKSVTIFGSTRTSEDNHWYKEAQKLGKFLAEDGFAVVTGGGPGIMEAVNRGAAEGDGNSVGLNIQLPHEQRTNPYVNKPKGFHYFFTRKLMLTYSAQAYVYFPGGFGTLDEFFEITTLIQEKKVSIHIPVLLVGKEYWSQLAEWIDRELYQKHGAIDKEDMEIYTIVDTAEEALAIIKQSKPRDEF